ISPGGVIVVLLVLLLMLTMLYQKLSTYKHKGADTDEN
ncbi:metal ABC transporter permease, partial [Staphylococcus arlettae]